LGVIMRSRNFNYSSASRTPPSPLDMRDCAIVVQCRCVSTVHLLLTAWLVCPLRESILTAWLLCSFLLRFPKRVGSCRCVSIVHLLLTTWLVCPLREFEVQVCVHCASTLDGAASSAPKRLGGALASSVLLASFPSLLRLHSLMQTQY